VLLLRKPIPDDCHLGCADGYNRGGVRHDSPLVPFQVIRETLDAQSLQAQIRSAARTEGD
jgi:hypothetical protein